MTSSLLLNTSTPTLGEVFSNGKTFEVPRFQRHYAWDLDQWEELWEDLLQCEQSGQDHYLGAIVLKTFADRKHFEVIDGQQRLVTISLVLLAMIDVLQNWAAQGRDADANKQRANLIRERFLSTQDPASLTFTSRLKLNAQNEGFFRANLLQLRPPVAAARLPESDKLLWNGFLFFKRQLDARFPADQADAVALARLAETLADRFLFIQIQVGDELDAYTVFETLNARGTQLTVTDLLKNYVFSRVASSSADLEVAEMSWERIVGGKEREFSKLLKHYWNSHHGVTRPPRLFKEIRQHVQTGEQAFKLLDQLEATAVLHAALNQPSSDALWTEWPSSRQYAVELDLFQVSQCYPLLYACWDSCPALLPDALRICSVISFRYVVIGRMNTQPMERAYIKAALEVRAGRIITARQLFEALKVLYVPDEQFEADFATSQVSTAKSRVLPRYILYRLENHLAGTSLSFESDQGTLEHILPENPDEGWVQAVPEYLTDIYRLGNYTLLERHLNEQAGRNTLPIKKALYVTSQYQLSSGFAWHEWNHRNIDARQKWMAKQAVACWRLNF
ncbi:MAG: DUF262 domain-containing protein [Rhizobacter sp.]